MLYSGEVVPDLDDKASNCDIETGIEDESMNITVLPGAETHVHAPATREAEVEKKSNSDNPAQGNNGGQMWTPLQEDKLRAFLKNYGFSKWTKI